MGFIRIILNLRNSFKKVFSTHFLMKILQLKILTKLRRLRSFIEKSGSKSNRKCILRSCDGCYEARISPSRKKAPDFNICYLMIFHRLLHSIKNLKSRFIFVYFFIYLIRRIKIRSHIQFLSVIYKEMSRFQLKYILKHGFSYGSILKCEI